MEMILAIAVFLFIVGAALISAAYDRKAADEQERSE